VSTESQPWIWGDIFGYYNRYIGEFFTALRREAER
jgi:hypothetical protein